MKHYIFVLMLDGFAFGLDDNGTFVFGESIPTAKPVEDGEAIMAAFKRFADTVPDDRLATFPDDPNFFPIFCRTESGSGPEVFKVLHDGSFIWKGREIGHDLRTARAVVGSLAGD